MKTVFLPFVSLAFTLVAGFAPAAVAREYDEDSEHTYDHEYSHEYDHGHGIDARYVIYQRGADHGFVAYYPTQRYYSHGALIAYHYVPMNWHAARIAPDSSHVMLAPHQVTPTGDTRLVLYRPHPSFRETKLLPNAIQTTPGNTTTTVPGPTTPLPPVAPTPAPADATVAPQPPAQ